MHTYDVIVIGGGPAGLGAAIETARHGASCLLLDENHRAGGQLFKQIHKFFGSRQHYAGMRGFEIGEMLLAQAMAYKVDFRLNTHVWGVFPGYTVTAHTHQNESLSFRGKQVVMATGATENVLSFPGNTLPGVITAGAAQTMLHVHGVKPGRKAVVAGSGNVGLIVAYQLMQSGVEVAAIVEPLSKASGYEVHANKLRKAGVPFYFETTVTEAMGVHHLEAVRLGSIEPQEPTAPAKTPPPAIIPCDLLCFAAGMSPRAELALLSGCKTEYIPAFGGVTPLHDKNMESTQKGLFVAGDLAGVEEASTALDEGRLAGLSVLAALGYGGEEELAGLQTETRSRLNLLRQGHFGEKRKRAKEEIINLAAASV